MLKSQSFSYTLGLSCNAHAYGMYLQAHTCTEQRVGSTLILSPIRTKGERGFWRLCYGKFRIINNPETVCTFFVCLETLVGRAVQSWTGATNFRSCIAMINCLLTLHKFYVFAQILCACTKNLCMHKFCSRVLIFWFNIYLIKNVSAWTKINLTWVL